MSFVAVAIGLTAATAGLSAYGSYQQGQAGKAANKYQANALGQQSALDAQSAEQNTTLTQLQASQDSKIAMRKASMVKGAQVAGLAANGTANGATAADIALDTFDTAKMDQLAIAYNANLKGWGINEDLKGKQWSIKIQQKQYRMAGKNAAIAGNIGAGISLLKGATQIATMGAGGGGGGSASSSSGAPRMGGE